MVAIYKIDKLVPYQEETFIYMEKTTPVDLGKTCVLSFQFILYDQVYTVICL